MTTEQLPDGLQLAVNIIREADPPGYLQDAMIRAAGLGALHTERDAAIKERDALRVKVSDLERAAVHRREISDGVEAELVDQRERADAQNDLLLAELRQVNTERDALRARLAEITPVPAQAVPDADGARFRWLCEDHSDRETRERCRSLIDRLPVMSYSDAVMSIDAAMGAIGRHGDDCIRDADSASESLEGLRELIAAALADARREGAEQMRAEAAKLARALPLYYGSGDDGADESLAQAIE